MLNIVKYEWLRRWKWFIAGLILFILMDLFAMLLVIKTESLGLLELFICFVFLVLVFTMAYKQIARMYKCLFTEEYQLLFMLPLSGYRILGGKLLAMLSEWAALILTAGLVRFIDLKLLGASSFPVKIDLVPLVSANQILNALGFVAFLIASYFIFLLTYYLSLVLAKGLFESFKHGKILSFVIFIVLMMVIGKITGLLLNGIYPSLVEFDPDIETLFQYVYCPAMALAMAYLVMLFSATGYLLDRKINI